MLVGHIGGRHIPLLHLICSGIFELIKITFEFNSKYRNASVFVEIIKGNTVHET